MLKVGDQFVGFVVGTDDAHVHGDVTVLGADGSMEVTWTPAGRTVSMASMARVQEKAFSSKS